MAGLRGQDRNPGQTVRTRRNAQNLASAVQFIAPDGTIFVDGDGYFQVRLNTAGGIYDTGTGIAIRLDETGDGSLLVTGANGLAVDTDELYRLNRVWH